MSFCSSRAAHRHLLSSGQRPGPEQIHQNRTIRAGSSGSIRAGPSESLQAAPSRSIRSGPLGSIRAGPSGFLRPGLSGSELLHPSIMHHGYLFVLALWAELVASGVIRVSMNQGMQSVIEDLQEALQNYSHCLIQTSTLPNLPALPCTETAAHLEQRSTLVCRLSQYQMCVQQFDSFCPKARNQTVTLNQDLLQHLNAPNMKQGSAGCPSSLTDSSPSTYFDSSHKFMQCVQCWSQQMEALSRKSLPVTPT